MANVDPESWMENGGLGMIREFNGVLFITQSYTNHVEIARILKKLQGAEKESVAIRSWLIKSTPAEIANLQTQSLPAA